jgi:proteasome regulatory subunit
VDVPDEEGRKEIFKIHSSKMKLDKKVDVDALITQMKEFTGAEIKATCTEAGYCAIRNNRSKIGHKDFEEALTRILEEKELGDDSHSLMFG